MNDPIARAAQWKLFYEQEGGLRDALDKMKAECVSQILSSDPNVPAAITALAIEARAIEKLRVAILGIVATGKAEEVKQERIKQIESLSPAQRRRL